MYAHAQLRRYLHIKIWSEGAHFYQWYINNVAQKDGAADGCEILRKRGNDSDRDLKYDCQQQETNEVFTIISIKVAWLIFGWQRVSRW